MDDVTALRDALVTKWYGSDALRVVFSADLDALIAAVEARAALTPERQEVMVEMLADVWCFATGGGTEGKWCINHDVPMADDGADCLTVARWRRVILAALPRPEEPRVERCAVCGVGRWVIAHDPEAGPSCHPFTPEAR